MKPSLFSGVRMLEGFLNLEKEFRGGLRIGCAPVSEQCGGQRDGNIVHVLPQGQSSGLRHRHFPSRVVVAAAADAESGAGSKPAPGEAEGVG